MIDLLTSPWIPAAVLALAASGARFLSKTWAAPSAFVLGFWSVLMVAPLVLAPEYKVSGLAAWVIVVMAGGIAVGAMMGEGTPSKPLRRDQAPPVKRILLASVIFTGAGLVGTVYFAFEELKAHSLDVSGAGLFLVGRLVALGRYDLGEQQPLLVRVLVLWVFPAALLGGMSYVFTKTRRQRILCLAWVAPALLYSLVNATRANTLIAIILGVSGYLSMRAMQSGKARVAPRKLLLSAFVALAVAVSFFFGIEAVRSNRADVALVDPIEWPRLKGTVLGYLPVFSHWIDNADNSEVMHGSMGEHTFGGLFDAVGLHRREVGLYTEFVALDAEQDNNIYTAFRGVIDDFSLIGALVFLLLTGFWGGFAYRRCRSNFLAWAPWMALFYAFVLWSPIVSLLNYNGPLVAAVSAGVLLSTNRPQPHSLP